MWNSGKSRNSDALARLKNESPKFKDVLRKKCHQRWRENRWKILDVNRSMPKDEEIEDPLTTVIKEDLRNLCVSLSGELEVLQDRSELDKNLEDLDEIENEISDDRLKWLLNEYDKILGDDDRLADLLDEFDHVICPVCQKNSLAMECNQLSPFVVCPCGLKIQTKLQLSQIKDNITKCMDIHNSSCNHNPQFETINEINDSHLYLVCYICCNFSMLL